MYFMPTLLIGQQNQPNSQVSQLMETFNGNQYVKVGNQWKVFNSQLNEYSDVSQNEITIHYVTGVPPSAISNFETQHGLILKRKSDANYYNYDISNIPLDLFSLANNLNNSSLTDYVLLPNFGSYLQTPNDALYINSTLWYLDKIQAPQAWDITTGSPNVKIAILDSGTKWELNDFGPGVGAQGAGSNNYSNVLLNTQDTWASPNDPSTGNGIDDDFNAYKDDYKGWNFESHTNDSRGTTNLHGTMVAGIVAAKTHNGIAGSGIAGGWSATNPGCKLLICHVGTNEPSSFPTGVYTVILVVDGQILDAKGLSIL